MGHLNGEIQEPVLAFSTVALHPLPKGRSVCVGGVGCGCVWQMALGSHPGTPHATLNIPLMPPHAHSVYVTAYGALFPLRFCSVLFSSESQLEGQVSPAPLLRGRTETCGSA